MSVVIDEHIATTMAQVEKLQAYQKGLTPIVRLVIEEIRLVVLAELFDQYGYEFIPSVEVIDNLLTYTEKLLINGQPSDEYYFTIQTDTLDAGFKVKMGMHEQTFIGFLYMVNRVNRKGIVDKLIKEILSNVPVKIDGIDPPEVVEDGTEKILSGQLLQIKKIEPMKSRVMYSLEAVSGESLSFCGDAQYFSTAGPGDFISAMKGDIRLIKKKRN